MTILQKFESSVSDWSNPFDRLLALAYIAGQENATKKICDEHNRRISKMREFANNQRYHILANAVIDSWKKGAKTYDEIYSEHYAQDVSKELCADEFDENLILQK